MKRLFIILLILCPLFGQGIIQAQIYSTASGRHHSYSNAGSSQGSAQGSASPQFQSTSAFRSSGGSTSFATAPMRVANGSVKTVASSLTGGVLSEDTNTGGYIPENGQNNGAVIAGVPDTNPTPIGDGWDVALLLAVLCVGYVVRRYLAVKR